MGVEIMEQSPSVDVVLVPVGGAAGEEVLCVCVCVCVCVCSYN